MVLFANESKLEECQNVNESSELNVLEGGAQCSLYTRVKRELFYSKG